jgi:hypothetical protein
MGKKDIPDVRQGETDVKKTERTEGAAVDQNMLLSFYDKNIILIIGLGER